MDQYGTYDLDPKVLVKVQQEARSNWTVRKDQFLHNVENVLCPLLLQ